MERAMKLFKLGRLPNLKDASPEREDLRNEVWKMISLLREAKGGGVSQEFAKRLKFLDDHRDEIQRGLIAGICLIEVFVQDAERARPRGGGKIKKAQAKSAMFHILTSAKLDIPGVPPILQPLVIDIIVDWSIDALVSVANDYALWGSDPPEPGGRLRSSIMIWLKRAIDPLWQPVAEFLIRMVTSMKYREPLPPELRAAVLRVERDGLVATKNLLLKSGTDFLKFLGEHRSQAAAGVKLVFEAVHLSESFLSLSGPDKKKRARDLIIATLEDLGFPVGSGLIGVIVECLIDTGIESAVSIFSARAPEAFKHRRTLAAAPLS